MLPVDYRLAAIKYSPMKKTHIIAALLCSTLLGLVGFAPAYAQHSENFLLPSNSDSQAVTGVIEWPAGKLHQWNYPIVVLVPPAGPNNRDGWLALALKNQKKHDKPFADLSAQLRKVGFGVVRFEHPAAKTPSHRCKEVLRQGWVNDYVLRTKCIDYDLIGNLTVSEYRATLINVLSYAQKRMPFSRGKTVVFGFSEGLIHAAAVADTKKIPIAALISAGSPAEKISDTARWQAVERILELLPRFDQNADGTITNEEIQDGYSRGIGNVMVPYLWLSPDGRWDENNIDKLKSRLEIKYAAILAEFAESEEPGSLHWLPISENVNAPYVTDSFWRNFFHGPISTAEIIERQHLPGLYLWGDDDAQVSIARQLSIVQAANERGAKIQVQRFPGRSHLLSRDPEEIWFESEFAPVIAQRVRQFLDEALLFKRPNRGTGRLSHSNSLKSALTRQQSAIPSGMDTKPSEGDSNHARNLK